MRLYEVTLTHKKSGWSRTINLVALHDTDMFNFLTKEFPEYGVKFGDSRVIDHNVFVAPHDYAKND